MSTLVIYILINYIKQNCRKVSCIEKHLTSEIQIHKNKTEMKPNIGLHNTRLYLFFVLRFLWHKYTKPNCLDKANVYCICI